jgi:hypothetical protein
VPRILPLKDQSLPVFVPDAGNPPSASASGCVPVAAYSCQQARFVSVRPVFVVNARIALKPGRIQGCEWSLDCCLMVLLKLYNVFDILWLIDFFVFLFFQFLWKKYFIIGLSYNYNTPIVPQY